MQNKILIILGSPRGKGNSSSLAKEVESGALAVGAEVETISLQKLKISPCNACDACVRDPVKGCIINDDMIPLYKKVQEADCVVLASPIYWFNYSAQLKLFIDRTYAIQQNNQFALTGKHVAIILTYADDDLETSGGQNALKSLIDMCEYVKANVAGVLHGKASDPGEIKSNIILMDDANTLGDTLANLTRFKQ